MSVAQDKQPPTIPPSEDPNRREVLLVSHLNTSARESRLVIYDMIRDSAGQLTELRAFQDSGREEPKVELPLLDAFATGFDLGMHSTPDQQ